MSAPVIDPAAARPTAFAVAAPAASAAGSGGSGGLAEPVRPDDELREPDSHRELEVLRYRDGQLQPDRDAVSEEWPVALVFNGISHAVMMCTPDDLEALGIGFALSEGVVREAAEIFDCEVVTHAAGSEVRITIAQPAFLALRQQRRTLAGRTGCGLCGIESLSMLDLTPDRAVAGTQGGAAASGEAVGAVARELSRRQRLMAITGGVHAAAWCRPDGAIVDVCEDVGRHNALDKLIGRLARRRASFGDGFVFMSSRASYELVRKAQRLGIPMLATISAPTTLAVRIAEQAGMRLVSFCRENGYVQYAGPPPPERAIRST